FFIISIIGETAVNAEEVPLGLSARRAGGLSLNGAVAEALKSNPEILAAKRNYEAASARIWQAASLSDPMLELEYDKIAADRMLSGDPMKSYAISQEVPFPTKIFLRAKIASRLAKMAYENYKAKERGIISQVKSTYSELYLIYKSIEITNENKAILGQFAQVATTRYSKGLGTQADALKAQVELAKADNELIMLEQRRVTSQARLNLLLNRDPKEETGVPVSEKPIKFNQPIEEFYSMAKINNPELKSYRYAIERGKAAYDLSLNEFMPDFVVKFKQMVKKDSVDEKAWAGMLGVTIPLWFFEKQAFGVKEMYSELEMLKAEYKTKENMVLFDVRDSYARAEANKKLVELYMTAFIPQAEQ
ncbi:MAG: TolC family protein, partial [Candidatus Omnitrophota bacterium]|nr:TolC family protein [Candidatus Omnitrophota bacterium]